MVLGQHLMKRKLGGKHKAKKGNTVLGQTNRPQKTDNEDLGAGLDLRLFLDSDLGQYSTTILNTINNYY